MSTVDPSFGDQAVDVVPQPKAGIAKPLIQRINTFIRGHTSRFLNIWSALTIVVVVAIFTLCILLWDYESIRPILATVGAGLAAFLGPIPGIISAEARSKWLVTIFVSALIAAGTWFATQDLADQVKSRESELTALTKRLDTQKDFTITLLSLTQGDVQDAVFVQAAELLKSLQLAKQYQSVLDLAAPMLRLRPENGTALAFVGYAYRGLGDMPEAKRRLQNYIAAADNVPEARDGAQQKCYARSGGFCAERTGWIEHLLAALVLRQAHAAQSVDEKSALYLEAFEHEQRNVLLPKWNRPGKDQGFGVEPEEPLSSCAILDGVIAGLKSVGRAPATVSEFKRANLQC